VAAAGCDRPAGPGPARPGGPAGGQPLQDAEATLVTTTLEGPDRWFVLTASLQRAGPPAGAYDRVLASFRLS
jgi:hypothetical protein